MLTEDFIRMFVNSLELKERQLANYENLLKNKGAKEVLEPVLEDEAAHREALSRVFRDIVTSLQKQNTPKARSWRLCLMRPWMPWRPPVPR